VLILSESIVKVGERYTIVIPKEVRRSLGIKKGQLLRVVSDGEKIIIEPLPDDPFKVFEQILGDFQYSKEDRLKAEKLLLKEVEKDTNT